MERRASLDSLIAGRRLGGTATRSLAKNHPAADGHFPGNPIIPGAVLLREIVAAVCATSEAVGAARRLTIRSAKFHHPVRPGDTLVVRWTVQTEEVRFTCSVAGSDRPVVTGILILDRKSVV